MQQIEIYSKTLLIIEITINKKFFFFLTKLILVLFYLLAFFSLKRARCLKRYQLKLW